MAGSARILGGCGVVGGHLSLFHFFVLGGGGGGVPFRNETVVHLDLPKSDLTTCPFDRWLSRCLCFGPSRRSPVVSACFGTHVQPSVSGPWQVFK